MATREIQISPGDTLSQLAIQHGTTISQLMQANPQITDPDFIRAGDALTLPGQAPDPVQPRTPDQVIQQPTQPFQLPDIDPDATPAFEAAQRVMDATPETMLAQFEAQRMQQVERDRAQRDELTDERRRLAGEQARVIEDAPSREVMVREEQERLGVPQLLEEQKIALEEIRGLRQQAINLEEQKAEALATSEGRKAPIGFIRGEQARVAETFDRRIATVSARMGAETATLEATQGMVSQARALVSDVVEAATFDTQMELQRIQGFREVNQQELAELDQSIQRDLENSQRFWEQQLAQEQQEKTQVMNLMIDNPRAGITINDSLEKASEKASIAGATDQINELALKAIEAGATHDLVRSIRESGTVGEATEKMARGGLFKKAPTPDGVTINEALSSAENVVNRIVSDQSVTDTERREQLAAVQRRLLADFGEDSTARASINAFFNTLDQRDESLSQVDILTRNLFSGMIGDQARPEAQTQDPGIIRRIMMGAPFVGEFFRP